MTVTGEVLNPITTGFEIDSTYEDYIEAAGGLTFGLIQVPSTSLNLMVLL